MLAHKGFCWQHSCAGVVQALLHACYDVAGLHGVSEPYSILPICQQLIA